MDLTEASGSKGSNKDSEAVGHQILQQARWEWRGGHAFQVISYQLPVRATDASGEEVWGGGELGGRGFI